MALSLSHIPSPVAGIHPEMWRNEMVRLGTALKKQGITEVKAGMELEFDLNRSFQFDDDKFDAHVHPFLQDIYSKAAQENEPRAKEKLQNKANAMLEFTPAEWLMYELIEKNPRTKDILEYSFGKGLLGSGYYDNPGSLELRLKPVSPDQLMKNHTILLEEMDKLLAEYGLMYQNRPSRHISVSFWKNQDNAMDMKSPSHLTIGAQITEGITRTLYDGCGILSPVHRLAGRNLIGACPSRHSILRQANGRLEVRLFNDMPEYQHPEAILTMAMAGALHGLKAHELGRAGAIAPSKPNIRLIFNQSGHEATHLLHFLNTFHITDDSSRMEFDRHYFIITLADISAELGLLKKDSQEYLALQDAAALASRERYPDKADFQGKELFSHYKNQALQLITKIEGDAAGINLPAELAHLEGKLGYSGSFRSFYIPESYGFEKALPDNAAVTLLQKSEALQNTLSPLMFNELKKTMEKNLGTPEQTTKLDVEANNKRINAEASFERYGTAPPL